ncbi:ef hand family protein [Chrysochromulina tobinii]|uniref:Ef hand family protein n=1 Tax=Chrysochromulina tobinii TaxID=1460289 RepID=A0A0M0JVS3_9EUKA|nr:ef hand family protein [Chrysochromulina tobinii]|eukprot:KOO30670.1 ef hand family protein [Chrysochromulina sp. CCMP291]
MEVLASLTVGIGGGLPLGGDNISDEAAEELAAAAGAAASELAAVLATVQQLDTVAAQAVTSGLSSLFGLMAASDGSPSSASAGEQISAAVEQMARAATAAALVSATVPSSGIAEPVVLSSENLNMTINVRSPSALAAEPISCDSGTGVAAAVAVPADLIGSIPGLVPSVPVAAVLRTSRVNLHGGLSNVGNVTSTAGPTVSFKISQGGAELSVKDAPSPINISLAYQSPAAGAGQAPCVGVPDPFSAAARACGTTVQCKFWNEISRSWSTDGCATIMGADGSVGCSCTHLTEFIAVEFPTSAEELLALLLEAVAFNSLDMGDIECAFYRSWHTVRNVWYLIFFLVAMLMALVGHAVRNDRRQLHDTLALLSDGSADNISLSDPVVTPSNESASAMAALAFAPTRPAGLLADLLAGASALPASADDLVAAPSAATASVVAALRVGAKPTGLQRWKQAKHKTNATLLTKRWHKDVDRVWKRLFLACMFNHSLCAGITTRGVPGFTRAQTVMILVNGFAFELVMLLLLLPAPPPLLTDNVTGMPIEPEGPLVINPIGIIFGAGVAASICIPMGLILTWLFDPIIIVNVSKNMAWFYLCWPYWLVWNRLEKCYRWLRDKCKRRSAKVAEHSDEDPASKYAVASPPVSAKVKKTFARFDVNHSGYLEIQELRKALEHHGLNLSTAEAGRILSVYDDKPNGKLDLSEFGQTVRDLSAADEAPKVKQTFARFDANDSGYLEIQELRKALEHHGLNLSTAEAGRILSSYDDKPNGKLDLSEFAQVIHDLSAADEAPAAPEPVMEKTKTHMRVGRHGVNVRKAAPKDKADKGEADKAEADKAEAPRLAANSAARSFSYESLNDGLLKASLSYTWKNKDWPGVRHILLGWGLSIGMFGIFLLMTLFFGCSLFEPQDPAKNPYLPPLEEGEVSTHVPGDTVELIRAWLFSCGLRFFLNEPMIILASKGLPMLFASAFCANLCGEVIVESLNLLVTIMIEVIKSIKS